jgi:DNA-binding transcriptional MerR regulator
LKIKELVQRTQISKETIHYYIREGLLPKPRKRCKNIADYDEGYIEKIRQIKELQYNHFLPLAVIKEVLKNPKKFAETHPSLDLPPDDLRPQTPSLPQEVIGEEAYHKATGLKEERRKKLEEWEILTPKVRDGQKVYLQDEIALGRFIEELENLDPQAKDRGDWAAMKHYRDLLREIVILSHKSFIDPALGKLSADELSKRILQGGEILSLFFYHLYRKLSREEHDRILQLMSGEGKGLKENVPR